MTRMTKSKWLQFIFGAAAILLFLSGEVGPAYSAGCEVDVPDGIYLMGVSINEFKNCDEIPTFLGDFNLTFPENPPFIGSSAAGFCGDLTGGVNDRGQFQVKFYSSLDNLPFIPSYLTIPWNKINYVLTHYPLNPAPTTYSWLDVQAAVWVLIHGCTPYVDATTNLFIKCPEVSYGRNFPLGPGPYYKNITPPHPYYYSPGCPSKQPNIITVNDIVLDANTGENPNFTPGPGGSVAIAMQILGCAPGTSCGEPPFQILFIPGNCPQCSGSIGDFVWNDLNKNGFQDADEPGINGVTVRLEDSSGTIIATSTTGPNGHYEFTGLCAGTYHVTVDGGVPAGFTSTKPCSDVTSTNPPYDTDSNSDDTGTCTSTQTVVLTNDNPDNPTIDFGFVSECDLRVDKKCFIAPPPPPPFPCSDAKPIDTLVVKWDGTVQPIYIRAWNGPVGSGTPQQFGPISKGQDVTFKRSGTFPNDIYFEIFTDTNYTKKYGVSTFHLSCSDIDMNGREDCGKPAGDGKGLTGYINDWIFEGMTGKGLVLDCLPPPPVFLDECSFVAPPSPDCSTLGKPKTLTFMYTGLGCDASSNNQPSDKWYCKGDPGTGAVPVTIVKDPARITMSPSSVNVGDLVTASVIGTDMGAEIILKVGGQELKIHTSCSQPLAVGDVFGSLELVMFNGQTSGAEVTYSYQVKNFGANPVDVTSLKDDKLGELLTTPPIPSLVPGNSLMIDKTALIIGTTENTVTVLGNITGTGAQCYDQDKVTISVTESPPCVVKPMDFKIGDKKIEWKLLNNSTKKVTIGSISISWPNGLGRLKKVKREKDTIWQGLLPSPATITAFINDLSKRQIKPGETKRLIFEFEQNAPTVPGEYSITVNFKEGCSITF